MKMKSKILFSICLVILGTSDVAVSLTPVSHSYFTINLDSMKERGSLPSKQRGKKKNLVNDSQIGPEWR